MKKTIALIIAMVLMLNLTACSSLGDLIPRGGTSADGTDDNSETPSGDTTQGGTDSGNGEASGGIDNETATLSHALPAIGENIYFGDYDWLILDTQGDKALLLSNYVLEIKAYHNELTEVTWADCDLRAYLNGEFYNSFDADDRARIVTVTNQNPDNPWSGTGGCGDTQDNIFLLSLYEVAEYLSDDIDAMKSKMNGDPILNSEGYTMEISDGFFGDEARKALHIDIMQSHYVDGPIIHYRPGCDWWLRSSGVNSYSAACVNSLGGVEIGGLFVRAGERAGEISPKWRTISGEVSDSFDNCGVRPAMWITLETSSSGGETPNGEGETVSTAHVDISENGNTPGNLLNNGYAAYSDGWIYYLDADRDLQAERDFGDGREYWTETISKMREDGSERTVLIDYAAKRELGISFGKTLPLNINVTGDWVYFTAEHSPIEPVPVEEGGGPSDMRLKYPPERWICKMRTDGTELTTLLYIGDAFIPGKSEMDTDYRDIYYPDFDEVMTVADGWIYYEKDTYTREDNGLYRVRTDGTGNTLLVKGITRDVCVIGDWIYYMLDDSNSFGMIGDSGTAWKVRTDGTGRSKIMHDYADYVISYQGDKIPLFIVRMIVDGESIYLCGSSGTGWYRFDMDARNGTPLKFSHGDVNIADGFAYHARHGDGLYHIRLDSGETVLLKDSYSIDDINIAQDWIFCNMDHAYVVMRTDGSDLQELLTMWMQSPYG